MGAKGRKKLCGNFSSNASILIGIYIGEKATFATQIGIIILCHGKSYKNKKRPCT